MTTKTTDYISLTSGKISSRLEDRRERMNKLSSVHGLLQKLQFLMDLPTTLTEKIDNGEYGQAVRVYQKARRVLEAYKDMPSFKGIYDETSVIVDRLREKLKERFGDVTSTPQQLAECVELLLELGEPPELLCQDFLDHSQLKLDEDIAALQSQLDLRKSMPSKGSSVGRESPVTKETSSASRAEDSTPRSDGNEDVSRRSSVSQSAARSIDVLEFIDEGSNGFLSNICLVIASYNDMFLWNAKMSQVGNIYVN